MIQLLSLLKIYPSAFKYLQGDSERTSKGWNFMFMIYLCVHCRRKSSIETFKTKSMSGNLLAL